MEFVNSARRIYHPQATRRHLDGRLGLEQADTGACRCGTSAAARARRHNSQESPQAGRARSPPTTDDELS